MSDIERIKERLDIVDIISSYVSDVKKAGVNYKAVCPFHHEKTPSFMINPNLQIYKCFGCGKGGDVISFLQEIERIEFRQALELAAQKAGLELSTSFKSQTPQEKSEREELLRANELTAKYYNYILTSHKLGVEGRKYAQKRMLNGEVVKKFLVGFAPNDYSNLKKFLLSKGFQEKKLVDWGLIVVRNGKTIDKFRDRLMQPIWDERGNIVGFSGRYIGKLENTPKYLNSPETIVYKKGKLLYSLYHAKLNIRETNTLIIVEGNIDILSSHRVGVGNIVAPLGTAFTLEQAKRIKQVANEVHFCFDSDAAGFQATLKALEIAESIGLLHKTIDISPFQDADEMIKSDQNLWLEKIKKPIETLDYIKVKLLQNIDLGIPSEKSKFYIEFLEVLRKVKNTVQKNFYIKDIAFLLDIPEADVRADLDSKAEKNSDRIVKLQKISTEAKQLEEFCASIILQNNFTEFNVELFKSPTINQLLSAYLKNTSLNSLHLSLTKEMNELLEKLSLYDLSSVDNTEVVFKQKMKELEERNINLQIEELTKKIKLSSDEKMQEELLNKVNLLTKRKKQLQQAVASYQKS